MKDLSEIRKEIDSIDSKLIELFCARMDIVKEVAAYKIANDMQVLHPEREEAILQRAAEAAGEEYAGYARALFSELMRLSRDMQQKMIDERE